MAKDKDKEAGVYRIVDVIGVSTVSWEDAAKRAVETAAKSLRDLRIAEVTKMDLKVEEARIVKLAGVLVRLGATGPPPLPSSPWQAAQLALYSYLPRSNS
jgi:flavin-binding protein dodecin